MNLELLASLAAAALGICALAAALIAQQAAQRWRAQCESLASSIAALRRELELIASINARTVRRVQRVEQEFSGIAERVDLVSARVAPGPESLGHAIDLARRGAGSERLSEQFGLTTGEADLVARLHGRAKAN
jgi:isocitrate/isopropylmalate dehydrogenase